MSGNPTVLRRTTGETINLLDASRMPIDSGDLIVLERSQITLKFLIRRAASLAPEPQSGEEATTGVDNEEA